MQKCETCEHNSDSSTEYCGTCDSITSNWSEAGWIKDNKIKELQFALERIRDIALSDNGAGEKLIKEIAIKSLEAL